MDFGSWEGDFPHVIMQKDPQKLAQWWSDPAELRPPSGEPFPAFKKRVLKGWGQLIRKHKGQQILLVTHPGVLRVLLSDVLGISSEHFFSLNVEHGTLSRIRIVHDEGGTWASLMSHGC